jgi:hypothetical protein
MTPLSFILFNDFSKFDVFDYAILRRCWRRMGSRLVRRSIFG